MLQELQQGAPGQGIEPARRPRRVRMTFSVMASTLDRLDELAQKWGHSRGVMVDKMAAIMHVMVKTGRVKCCTGQDCTLNRQDVPEVF
jgi:hypothetical protein